MAQYKTGTVTVTQNSTAVVGIGTAWASNLAAGNLFALSGSGVWYQVASVQSDTHLTLSSPYAGATTTASGGDAYQVQRDFTPNNQYPTPTYGDSDATSLIALTLMQIDAQLAALAPANAALVGQVTLQGVLEVNQAALAPVTVPYAAAITLDLTKGRDFVTTLTGAATLSFNIGGQLGQHGFLRVYQDATGGRVPTFSALKAAGGALAYSSGGGKCDLYKYRVLSATDVWVGVEALDIH